MTCPRCGRYGDGCNCDAASDSYFWPDLEAIDNEWRTEPTDHGGWANRAMKMLMLARKLYDELERRDRLVEHWKANAEQWERVARKEAS